MTKKIYPCLLCKLISFLRGGKNNVFGALTDTDLNHTNQPLPSESSSSTCSCFTPVCYQTSEKQTCGNGKTPAGSFYNLTDYTQAGDLYLYA